MTIIDTPDFESPAQASARLGVTERTLRKWAAEGRLRVWKLGRRVRYSTDELNALIQPA